MNGLLNKANVVNNDIELIKKIVPDSMIANVLEKYENNQVCVNPSKTGLIFKGE